MAADPGAARARSTRLRSYFADSRDPLSSVLFVVPLFVAYQLGILFTGGVRNGVDFMTDALMLGLKHGLSLVVPAPSSGQVLLAYIGFNVAVLAGLLIAIAVLRHRGQFRPRLWPYLLLESTIYAFFFGAAVTLMMRSLGLDVLLSIAPLAADAPVKMDPFVALIQSIGAGLYEEIVFRAALLGGLFWFLTTRAKTSRLMAAIVATVVSSLVFSAVHHLGPMGDPFALGVFFYRFFSGVLLSIIFTTRGFAVAVYTHAIYDILVMVLG